jgi:hypothetical protein
MDFLINSFEPLYLSVKNTGPFQEKIYTFDFTDDDGEPCNFYFFISENGRGKTTLLELMAALMRMPAYQETEKFEYEGLDSGNGSAQWDIRLRLTRENKEECVILSLIAASSETDIPLKPWEKDDLEKAGAGSWHCLGCCKRKSGRLEPVLHLIETSSHE